MLRLLRRMPFFKVFVIAQTALLMRRHLMFLDAIERRRLAELVRRGPRLDRNERDELRGLLAKMQPGAFAFKTADRFSPVPLPRRFAGRSTR